MPKPSRLSSKHSENCLMIIKGLQITRIRVLFRRKLFNSLEQSMLIDGVL